MTMTPDQFQQFLESNERATADAIEKNFNGRLRKLDEKVDAHIAEQTKRDDESKAFREEVKPLLQGAAGLQLLWKVFVAVGSLAVAWAAMKGVFR